MIDVGVSERRPGRMQIARPFSRISPRPTQHVDMDFFLQIDANGSIRTDHLIGAHSGGCRNVAARVGNSNVRAIVANDVMSSLYGSGHEAFEDWSRGREKSSAQHGMGVFLG